MGHGSCTSSSAQVSEWKDGFSSADKNARAKQYYTTNDFRETSTTRNIRKFKIQRLAAKRVLSGEDQNLCTVVRVYFSFFFFLSFFFLSLSFELLLLFSDFLLFFFFEEASSVKLSSCRTKTNG